MLSLNGLGPGYFALVASDHLAGFGYGVVEKTRRVAQFFGSLAIFLNLEQAIECDLSIRCGFKKDG